jgi:hypothetical protein
MDAEEFIQSPDQLIQSAYRKILTLTAQKAILAMKRARGAHHPSATRTRWSRSVLKNARITEGECRATPDAQRVGRILRTIGVTASGRSCTSWRPIVRNPRRRLRSRRISQTPQ